MKFKFLAAAASIAFIASGVAASAQQEQKHEQQPAAHAQPNAAGGAMKEQGAGKAAQAEPRNENKGAQGAEMKAEHSRGAEAPGQERKVQGQAEQPKNEQQKTMQQGQNEKAEGQKHTAQPNGAQAPAARTGANEQEKNAPRTGAAERNSNAPRTGANEQEKNAPRTGANEQKNAPRTGANDQNQTAPRTGANEQQRNNMRTGANEQGRGQPRVQGNVKMSTEHATRVSETLMREGNRSNVNINVRVGERVPQTVQLRPLPSDVIAIVPEYRGYDYFIDESDEIVFVSPQTHEIVGMIDYEGRAASEDNYTHVRASRPCPTED